MDDRRQESGHQEGVIPMDRSFVMVKPDGVQRGLVGNIVSRLEAKGLKLVAARFENLPEARVTEQYKEHLSKPFFPSLKTVYHGRPVLPHGLGRQECCCHCP